VKFRGGLLESRYQVKIEGRPLLVFEFEIQRLPLSAIEGDFYSSQPIQQWQATVQMGKVLIPEKI
jgi:hypothetical protein